ncbi:MAG: RagB/SusD family nutrient uptake outer membrane protein [Pseudosphingobacterium sp.]|nr:RagB/SusD family nutrient uptake outer membrane protein [Pseudosphingobacterium sp.]
MDSKPSSSIVQPTTLDEFEALLDNAEKVGTTSGLAVLAGDEYIFSSDAIWLSARTATERNSYIWAPDIYEGETSPHWDLPYSAIFFANNVLQGLNQINVGQLNLSRWNNIRGWALFVRAFAYYELVTNFAATYDESTASTDLGVPLRLNPSVDEILPRSTVQETYDRIFADLEEATALLDGSIPNARTRPSKIAAHALFARIHLNRREYVKAELHADSCLALYNSLLDYNSLNKTSISPFAYNHTEQIYAKTAVNVAAYSASAAGNTFIQMPQELIDLYQPNDLRLTIFFMRQSDGSYDPKRGYYGPTLYPYVGLATDEIYLIKAECLARRGETQASMSWLNNLLIKRWNPNATSPAKPYENIVAQTLEEALTIILLERRKELVWRGLRWEDFKRLNKEGAGITLTRTINGQTYTLPPNSPKYIFPIPDNEINLSGIQQNLRN